MRQALEAWLRSAAEGADEARCFAAAVAAEPDPWTSLQIASRLAGAQVRVATEAIGLTTSLNVRAPGGLGVVARVPAGRRYPEGGATVPVDRELAMRWIDAGRSVGRGAPDSVLIIGAGGGALPLAAVAWAIPRVVVVEPDPVVRRVVALVTPSVVVLDAPTDRWPCVIGEGADWATVAAHVRPGGGIGLRVGADLLAEPAFTAWMDRQSVRGRTGPERGVDGETWLLGLVAGALADTGACG